MRRHTIHKRDVVLNRKSLNEVLKSRGWDFSMLHNEMVSVYGVDISYKGFMSLVSNRSSWKLVYAVIMVEILNIEIDSIFDLIDIDVEKKLDEKRAWIKKYQKD